jgi:hypothetical protein
MEMTRKEEEAEAEEEAKIRGVVEEGEWKKPLAEIVEMKKEEEEESPLKTHLKKE